MTLVLDAGALLAVDRDDAEVVAAIKRERGAGRTPRTHGGVVGQVWRDGYGRQARLARTLSGCEVVPLGDELGRRAGVLLGQAGQRDVIHAALVLVAEDGDLVLTSDPDDLARLAGVAGRRLALVPL